jgi:hypothetical protein
MVDELNGQREVKLTQGQVETGDLEGQLSNQNLKAGESVVLTGPSGGAVKEDISRKFTPVPGGGYLVGVAPTLVNQPQEVVKKEGPQYEVVQDGPHQITYKPIK